MIGGRDIVVRGEPAEGELAFVVSWLRRHAWPDLVVQDDEEETLSTDDRRLATAREVFVYASRAACEAWARDGGVEANLDTMIQVIVGAGATTLVTADPGTRTHQLGGQLRDALLARRVFVWLRGLPLHHHDTPEEDAVPRFRELMAEITMDLDPENELQRQVELQVCWLGMTDDQIARLEHDFTGLPPQPTGHAIDLVDRDVNVGESTRPVHRAA